MPIVRAILAPVSGTFTGGRAPRVALPGVGLAIPNVPDNYLGWGANLGLNWKLLENLTFNSTFAYWQPGNWFQWAYQDYGSTTITTVNGHCFFCEPQSRHRSSDWLPDKHPNRLLSVLKGAKQRTRGITSGFFCRLMIAIRLNVGACPLED